MHNNIIEILKSGRINAYAGFSHHVVELDKSYLQYLTERNDIRHERKMLAREFAHKAPQKGDKDYARWLNNHETLLSDTIAWYEKQLEFWYKVGGF